MYVLSPVLCELLRSSLLPSYVHKSSDIGPAARSGDRQDTAMVRTDLDIINVVSCQDYY